MDNKDDAFYVERIAVEFCEHNGYEYLGREWGIAANALSTGYKRAKKDTNAEIQRLRAELAKQEESVAYWKQQARTAIDKGQSLQAELKTLLEISACPAESHYAQDGDTLIIKRFRQICYWMYKMGNWQPKLIEFANEMLSFCQEGVDPDGGDIQEIAEKVGLIEEYNATEPCCEHCTCAEVFNADWPVKCYRKTDWTPLPPTDSEGGAG